MNETDRFVISNSLHKMCSLHSKPSNIITFRELNNMIVEYITKNNLWESKKICQNQYFNHDSFNRYIVRMDDILNAATKLNKQNHKSTIDFYSLITIIIKTHCSRLNLCD